MSTMEPSWNSTDDNPLAFTENASSGAALEDGLRWERVLGLALWAVLIGVLLWVGAD